MPNLYNKLMAKDMPGAAPAPTARQMVQAPMGLRSAMRRYADGGGISSFSGDDGRSNQSLSFPQLSDPDEARRQLNMEAMRSFDIVEPNFPKRDSGTAPYRPEENPRTTETRRPEPRYEEPRPEPRPEPRYEEPRPDPRPVMPEIYPMDYTGSRTSDTSQTQQVGPRTSYRQEADGTMTEIGYDGQPIAGYTPAQLAMHNATMGIDQPKFTYIWNGQGYDKVPIGAQIGYNPMENVAPQIPENMPIDTSYNRDEGYNEPPMFDVTQENQFDPIEYQNKQSQNESERLGLLRKALSGQGVGSLIESQRLAELLRSMGYSK